MRTPLVLIFSVVALCSVSPLALAAPKKSAPKTENAPQGPTEIVLDAVIASVDEKPITLSELQSRLSPPRKLTLQELGQDVEAQRALEALILERVLDAEAAAKRVSVTDTEIDEYINEVARRNSLSRTDFESVLVKEGKSVEWYKQQVKTDILRTKLASTISRGGVSVMDSEIDEYLKNNPSFRPEGASLKLRVIAIPREGATDEDLNTRLKPVLEALDSGEKFEEVAKRYSNGPHSAEGGLLGVVAEKDLSSDVFDAVLSVEPGSHSKPIMSESGAQIFFVEQRFSASDSEDDEDEESLKARREEARGAIQKQKTEDKLSAYFTTELFKNHSVDKKF